MPYSAQSWANGAAGATPLSAARLSNMETGIAAAATAASLSINLADRGVAHTATAATNTSAIQNAVEEAEQTGRPVAFPWVPPGSWIDINDRILIAAGGIALLGAATRIRQTTFPRPVFEVLGPDVTVDGFTMTASTWSATGFATSFRGETYQSYSCGVWVGAHRVTVRNIVASNFISAVRTSHWDVDAGADGDLLSDCVVEHVASSDVAFGLLVRGVDGFTFRGLRGSYKLMPGSGLPPHLLYFTDASDPGSYSTNVVGSDCYAYAGEYSFAYQIKHVAGGVFSNLNARDCFGVLHLMDTQDLQFTNVTSIGDTSTSVGAGSVDIEDTNVRVRITNLAISMADNGKPVRIDTGSEDCTLAGGLILSNHTASGNAPDDYDVDIQGVNNTVSNFDVRNLGATPWAAGIGIWFGTNNRIVAPRCSGNKTGVKVRGNVVAGRILDWDEDDVSIVSPGVRKIEIGAGAATINPRLPATLTMNLDRFLAYDRCNVGSGTPAGGLSTAERTTSGHAWVGLFGTFLTDGTRIRSTSGVNSSMVVDTSTADLELSAGIKYQNREFLLFRAVAYNTFLAIRLNHVTAAFEIYKKESGTDTVLATTSATVTVGRRHRLFVRAYGDRIEAGVDGTQLLVHTLSAGDQTTFGAQTRHGIGGNASANGWFDNIEWRSLA